MVVSLQYKTSKEGSTMGITVTHAAMLAHCRSLTQACGYAEGQLLFGTQITYYSQCIHVATYLT